MEVAMTAMAAAVVEEDMAAMAEVAKETLGYEEAEEVEILAEEAAVVGEVNVVSVTPVPRQPRRYPISSWLPLLPTFNLISMVWMGVLKLINPLTLVAEEMSYSTLAYSVRMVCSQGMVLAQ